MIDSIFSGRRLAPRRLGTIVFAAALAALLSVAAPAKAATINTYTFTQEGYSLGGFSGSVKGTFTGLVGSDGFMNLTGLTAFDLQLDIPPFLPALSVDMPTEFFFNTLGGNSTFALVVAMEPSAGPQYDKVCVGSLTAFRCGVSGNGAYPALSLSTMSIAQLTLVSSTAVTPIPAPILLFATALSGLGLLGARARRQRQAA